MPQAKQKLNLNGLVDFAFKMEEILHEGAVPFYHSKKRYPIDQEVLEFSEIEGLALYDRLLGYIPSHEQAAVLTLPSGGLIQATGSYSRYLKLEEDRAVDLYLEKLNNLVDQKAYSKAENSLVLTPNYHSFREEIKNFIKEKRAAVAIIL